MTKKTATPGDVSQAIALREAGYTSLAISQRLGISVRSLHRHFAEHGTKKGALKSDLIEAGRAELRRLVTSDETIRNEAARLISDDLAHSRHIREVMLSASEHLQAESLKDAVLVMRAAAAYTTAIKNTSDTLRRVLKLDREMEQTEDELPELHIRELSDQEIVDMKQDMAEEL